VGEAWAATQGVVAAEVGQAAAAAAAVSAPEDAGEAWADWVGQRGPPGEGAEGPRPAPGGSAGTASEPASHNVSSTAVLYGPAPYAGLQCPGITNNRRVS
jgi:hypothetical protein